MAAMFNLGVFVLALALLWRMERADERARLERIQAFQAGLANARQLAAEAKGSIDAALAHVDRAQEIHREMAQKLLEVITGPTEQPEGPQPAPLPYGIEEWGQATPAWDPLDADMPDLPREDAIFIPVGAEPLAAAGIPVDAFPED
jgi:hypothetical protein